MNLLRMCVLGSIMLSWNAHSDCTKKISPESDPLEQFVDCYITNESGSFTSFNLNNGVQIAVNPNDSDILVAYVNNMDFWRIPSIASSAGVSESPFVRSTNGGKTWSFSFVPLGFCNSGGTGVSDSVAIPSFQYSKNGTLSAIAGFNDRRNNLHPPFLAASGTVYVKSSNDGCTWSRPIYLDITNASKIGSGFVQNSGGHLLVDPEIQQNIYVNMQLREQGGGPQGFIRFTRSTDNGDSWDPAITIYNPITDPSLPPLIFGRAGSPYGAFIGSKRENVLISAFTRTFRPAESSADTNDHALIRSFDRGVTWEQSAIPIAPFIISTLRNPVSNRSVEHNFVELRLATDEKRKIIYAIWDGGDASINKTAIFLSISRDLGETWSTPIVISRTDLFANNPQGNNAFDGMICVTNSGYVGIMYYDFRHYASGSTFAATDCWLDVYKPTKNACGGSTGAGLDFVKEFRLTSTSFDLGPADDPSFSPLLNQGGLDARIGLVSRNGDFYTAFCQTNPVIKSLIVNPTDKPLAFIDFNPRVQCFYRKICKNNYRPN